MFIMFKIIKVIPYEISISCVINKRNKKPHIHGYMWQFINKYQRKKKYKNEKCPLLIENINRKYKGKTFIKSIYHVWLIDTIKNAQALNLCA